MDPQAPKSARVVKNPRFVLNPARLTGPRGIQVIPEHFKDFKFKGKLFCVKGLFYGNVNSQKTIFLLVACRIDYTFLKWNFSVDNLSVEAGVIHSVL